MTSSALGSALGDSSKRAPAAPLVPEVAGAALTYLYLATIWGIFAGVLMGLPHRVGDPGLLQLAGL